MTRDIGLATWSIGTLAAAVWATARVSEFIERKRNTVGVTRIEYLLPAATFVSVIAIGIVIGGSIS